MKILAKNNLFKTLHKNFTENFKNQYDISQTKSFDERLILVDHFDKKIDSISKLEGHLKSKKNNYPHRAFSVFLFDQEDRLLLQKRSSKKITFQNLWSNTCCSHPLDCAVEVEIENNIGIINAAVRRMNFELGIKTKISDYLPFQRILYKADSDNTFEEYELDYIILAKIKFDLENINKSLNPDEVSDIQLLTEEKLLEKVSQKKIQITPWFDLIIKNDKLNEIYRRVRFLKENVQRDEIKNDQLKIINYL